MDLSRSWAPTYRRSWRLLAAFTKEQSDPQFFYETLAEDTVQQLGSHLADPDALRGAVVLDVGGGPGYFRKAFEAAGARYLVVDADPNELGAARGIHPRSLVASGTELPLPDGSVDVCFSSNVLEHVAEPWKMADEMVRVVKPAGTIYLSYMLWWGPHGGHETSPWHLFSGRLARRIYRRRHGGEPKNKYGESLFRITSGAGLRWARKAVEVETLAAIPRYHPSWAMWVVKVPVVRELVTWNLLLVMRKKPPAR